MKHAKLLLGLFFSIFYLNADVVWIGKTAEVEQVDESVSDVSDENLTIAGDVQLPNGSISISALAQDVNVYFVGGPNPIDTTIRSNDLSDIEGSTELNLYVAPNRKIIFHIDQSNVRFRGKNNDTEVPLTIRAFATELGAGEIEFRFEQPNRSVQFTARPTSGGCEFYIVRSSFPNDQAPKVLFTAPYSSNSVYVGRRSLLGLEVGLSTIIINDGFVFDGTGSGSGDYVNVLIKPFSKICSNRPI